jgi:tetratricopeptide (TPR) repeat protein/predicted aspartyl protease
LCAVWVGVLNCVISNPAGAQSPSFTGAQSPSFNCNNARFPDEIAICRTPELAELDNVVAAAYAYLKSTRGRAYADQVGIPFWRLRQACQYDTSCIRQTQIQAINAYQAAGAHVVVPLRTAPLEESNSLDPSTELHLCRNSADAADKIAHCSNVIAQSSNVSALVTAHNTRGLALMDVGRFSEAVDDFTSVIRREPRIAGFYDNRQNAFRRSGRLDDALKDANEAIQLAPTYSFVYRGRANVYNDMGKYDLAVLDYGEAIRLAPGDGGLFIDRGKIFRTESKFDQAISDFSHALDLDNKWTAAYRERGLTYKLMGQSQPAVDDLAIYNRLEPGDQEVALALTELGSRQSPPESNNVPSASIPTKEPPSEQAGPISGPTIVPMVPEGGTFLVPVRINDQITLKFVIDSGASDVSVPADVVMTLLRTGTITDADFLGTQEYRMANGSVVPSKQFVIRSLKVGDRTLNDVTGGIAPVEGSLLLGQSFLRRFKSWSIDNQREALILN